MSTKHLLQRLTQWSKGQANEKNISDAYVQLGNDFKLVSKHFKHSGLDVADLGDVPMSLRRVLEVALRESPSVETLDRYLPRIREIIVTLLDKLKVKQALLKTMKQEKQLLQQQRISTSSSTTSLASESSTPSVSRVSNSVTPTSQLAQVEGIQQPQQLQQSQPQPQPQPRSQSQSQSQSQPPRQLQLQSEHQQQPNATSTPSKPGSKISTLSVPKQRGEPEDPLSQLKKGDTLQRRASKRFSAYHMAKLTNQAVAASALTNDVPEIDGKANFHPPIAAPEPASELTSRRAISTGSKNTRDNTKESHAVVVFLKLKDKTKKCTVDSSLTFNSLRLLFVEKFTYSPGGNSFPDIYIQEPGYDTAYELEEAHLSSIKDGSILKLHDVAHTDVNVTQHFEQLKKDLLSQQEVMLSGLRNWLNSSSSKSAPVALSKAPKTIDNPQSAIEINSIKRELSVLNQVHTNSKKGLQESIANILEKVKKFQSLSFNASTSANRVYVEKSHLKLSEFSDTLLSKVDDLQDVIETLRKDVAIRGSKPSKKKLETVNLELQAAQNELHKMEEYMTIEKPNWKRIWESELDKVCEEQQFLTLQEDLAFDLKEDLNKANETFDLVKMCCEEQEKNPKKAKSNPILPIAKPGTFNQIREALLIEVQTLNPDHDGRVEAIERAEKLREREKEYKENDEFEDELENFVGNSSFKKAGGIEEVERLRKQKDEENLRANFQ